MNTYHPQYFGTEETMRGVQDELESFISDDQLYFEYMDYRRNYDDEEYLDFLYNHYRLKYGNLSFSALIVIDDGGLDFIRERGDTLFPGVPVVFCGVNRSPENLELSGNMIGIFEPTEIKANIDLIQELNPELGKLVFISDRSSFGKDMKEQALAVLSEAEYRELSYELWDDFNLKSLSNDLRGLDKDDAVLLLAIVQDNRGEYFSYRYQLPSLCEASSVPVYAMWGITIGKGVIGGRISHPYQNGREAASLVKELLRGKSTEDFAYPILGHSKLTFDYNVLKRFSLEDMNLPHDAVIHNKPVTTFEKHKKQIIILLLIFLLETALIFYLYMSRMLITRINLELNHKQNQIQIILQETSASLWSYNPEAGYLRFYSRNCFFRRIASGYDHLFLSTYLDSIRPEDRDRFKRFIMDLESNEIRSKGIEYRVQCPDDSMLWVVCRGIREESGLVSGIMFNMTESRQKDIIIQRAQKMEAVGTLANGLAHDFNNSLTGIFGGLNLIKAAMGDDNSSVSLSLGKIIEIMEDSALQASMLTKDLMNLSRKKREDPVPIDLIEICNKVLGVFRTGDNKEITIHKNFPDGKAMICGIPSQIEQVVLNLLINAAQAIAKKESKSQEKKITISLFSVMSNDPGLPLHRDSMPDSRLWCLRIDDTGIGMNEDIQTRIFEPFFSTKKEKGNGLGLYMCYKIVSEHYGFLDVNSESGKGSSFILYFSALSEIIKENQSDLTEYCQGKISG